MTDCRDGWHPKFEIGDEVRLTKGLLNGDQRLKSGTEFCVKYIERKEVHTTANSYVAQKPFESRQW